MSKTIQLLLTLILIHSQMSTTLEITGVKMEMFQAVTANHNWSETACYGIQWSHQSQGHTHLVKWDITPGCRWSNTWNCLGLPLNFLEVHKIWHSLRRAQVCKIFIKSKVHTSACNAEDHQISNTKEMAMILQPNTNFCGNCDPDMANSDRATRKSMLACPKTWLSNLRTETVLSVSEAEFIV